MSNLRRFSSAFFFAVLVAVIMSVSSVTLDAASKRPPKDNGSICAYLQAIIDYPYTTDVIKAYALSLYSYFRCGEE